MTLQTLDEYKAKNPRNKTVQDRWQRTGVACPKCGKEMLQDSMVMLPSYPPKQYWQCSGCGHVEYV